MCRGKPTLYGGLKQWTSMTPPTSFAFWLLKATRAIQSAEFGEWKGYTEVPSINPADPPGRVRNYAKDKYDKRFWDAAAEDPGEFADMFGESLKLLQGKSAAAAIDAIIASPGLWRLDCDHTVQIANLYATMQTVGVDAFNARVGQEMRLRPRNSSGMKTIQHFGRDEYVPNSGSKPWRTVTKFATKPPPNHFVFEGQELSDTTEELVLKAPPGSRVRWTNLDAALSHEFRHENTVKLQTDVYAAGGLFNLITHNEYNRKNLEEAMSTDRSRVIIDEVEVFDPHG